MADIHYTDAVVANVVERDIENYARVITDSYCQLHAGNRPMDPATYTKAYFNVFSQTLRALEEKIKLSREKENQDLANMFK